MDTRIRKALNYIEKNFDKKISLDEVSKISNLSVSHFCFLFKKEIKICFSRYLKLKRLNRARKLLKYKSLYIKQIAYHVGYRDISNFDHEFKRFFGVSPSKFRKMPFLFMLRNTIKIDLWPFNDFIRFTNKKEKFTK